MNLTIRDGLPFVTAEIEYGGQLLTIENALLDTGSAGTLFQVERLLTVGVRMEPDDMIRRIRGVGGTEFVFSKQIDALTVGGLRVRGFEVEVGALDYGFDLDGIIGLDFLMAVGAKIDLGDLTIS
ncbi:retropepsin-like aspartic protease [Promineifilum sp.]|uniref:retropepsin-like aspartic protease n=1 Tax=Promineifilum sp. TaxID=2664178 RepID=UPI0035ADB567